MKLLNPLDKSLNYPFQTSAHPPRQVPQQVGSSLFVAAVAPGDEPSANEELPEFLCRRR